MKQPCNNCPFLIENGITLTAPRIEEIVNTLLHDGSFNCHKTIDYSSDEPRITRDSKLCFGSALFLENVALGGCRSNVIYRFGLKMGHFSVADLRKDKTVFQSLEDILDTGME